jgi:DNA-binding XRE family transcriptional regulator
VLQRIETGRGLPAWETGLRIARELGYDVTALEALFAEVKS